MGRLVQVQISPDIGRSASLGNENMLFGVPSSYRCSQFMREAIRQSIVTCIHYLSYPIVCRHCIPKKEPTRRLSCVSLPVGYRHCKETGRMLDCSWYVLSLADVVVVRRFILYVVGRLANAKLDNGYDGTLIFADNNWRSCFLHITSLPPIVITL